MKDLGSPRVPLSPKSASTLFRGHLLVPWGVQISKNIPLKQVETENMSIFVEKNVFFKLFI